MNILLIEDNLGDIELFREALSRLDSEHQLKVIENGDSAIDFLESASNDKKISLPEIIFLDINLPKKNGREILQKIKNQHSLSHIPVIMMSSSISDHEVVEAYRAHANCFILKQPNMRKLFEVIEVLIGFWSKFVELPKIKH